MHYLFFDETYRDMVNNKTIVVVSWAVDQGRLMTACAASMISGNAGKLRFWSESMQPLTQQPTQV